MFKETTYIYTAKHTISVGAAMFLAILLYPDNILRREEFVHACLAMLFKNRLGGQLKRKYVYKKEILEFSRKRKIDSQLSKALKILKKRKQAMDIFKFQLSRSIDGVEANIGNHSFSINRWIETFFPTSEVSLEEHNQKNAYERMWSPSKPILHIVWAFEEVLSELSGKEELSLEFLLEEPEKWLVRALNRSEEMRIIILKFANLRLSEKDQIRVLPKNE